MVKISRKDYLAGNAGMTDYYTQFISPGVLSEARRVLAGRKPEDVPLVEWDRAAGGSGKPWDGLKCCPFPSASAKMREAGDYYTLAGGVVLLRVAAGSLEPEQPREKLGRPRGLEPPTSGTTNHKR